MTRSWNKIFYIPIRYIKYNIILQIYKVFLHILVIEYRLYLELTNKSYCLSRLEEYKIIIR